MKESNPQDLIKWLKARRQAYYDAPATKGWMEMGEALQYAVDLEYDEKTRHMTRSKFHVTDILNAYEAQVETATATYGNANPLFVHGTKRSKQIEIAKKHSQFTNAIWSQSDNILTWLEVFREIPIRGMGVGYARWIPGDTNSAPFKIKEEEAPWGSFGVLAANEPELLGKAEIEAIHPRNWWGYWKTCKRRVPWEGINRLYTAFDLASMKGGAFYDNAAIDAEIKDLKKGGTGPDDNHYFRDDEDREDIEGMSTTQFYEWWGPLYGAPGYETDTQEYVVVFSDKRIIRKNVNKFRGFRPINRAVGKLVNGWACGKPTLISQLPSVDMKNLSVNLTFDEWLVKLHHGIAVWEDTLENEEEFYNPIGPLSPVRISRDTPADKLPRRIDAGSGTMLRDAVEFNRNFIEPGRQAASMDDVLSFKSGIQDGTARAADLVASQGARKGQSVFITAGETGLIPMAENLVALTLMHATPEQLKLLTRDGTVMEVTEEDKRLILANNFLDLGDSVRKDQFTEAKKMEAFLEKASPHLQKATDPDLMTKALRKWADHIGIDGSDDFLPLNSEMPQAPPPPPGMEQGMPPPPGAEMPQEQAQPELAGAPG